MAVRPHLSDRYQHILKATIQHYIATAEPVGSKTLVEEYNFNFSSATIRNALGKLEKEGFLYQPHTSSGRIPSDWGYRLYVDELMERQQGVTAPCQTGGPLPGHGANNAGLGCDASRWGLFRTAA